LANSLSRRDGQSGNETAAVQAALRSGRFADAEAHLLRILGHNSRNDFALALAGELRVAQRRFQDAALLYAQAVTLRPDVLSYKERFADLGRLMQAAKWDPLLAGALVVCLRSPEIDCSRLSGLWCSLVLHQPGIKSVFSDRDQVDVGALSTPLFIEGLKRLLVFDLVFEDFICHLRRRLLFAAHKSRSRNWITLAVALAHYAFNSDYILDVSAEEQVTVTQLCARVENCGSEPQDREKIALLACYCPLERLSNSAKILTRHGQSGPLKDLAMLQIADVVEFRAAAKKIPSLTVVGAGISAAVRRQYEEFPYPRWQPIARQKLIRDWEREECNRATEHLLRGRQPRILVAGCGTGKEAAMLATIFPDSLITAVDLSRASLGYAAVMAERCEIRNVSFHQADIMQLGSIDGEFDYISAAGVLHHLKDPAAGWKICARLLKSGGLMRIGLYSELARHAVVAAREIIAHGGYEPDAEGMRRFRRGSPVLLPKPVFEELTRFTDYYQLSMYRDLLFHVQEHRFTIPQIAELLRELRLRFSGFYLPADVLARYSAAFPEDRTRSDLKNWHRFETENPREFRNMYIFWCRKNN
jgi:ubiquinone/menaquinone biosynthesis C-methylase UbiE